MSNKDILERVITKAIDGGYELVKTKDWIWQVGEDTATGLCIHITPDTEKIGLITYISYPIAYERIIFNHDFAKALWGVSEHTTLPGTDPYGEEDCEHCEANIWDSIPHYCWQYHLQQMVIADDTIKYLGENI